MGKKCEWGKGRERERERVGGVWGVVNENIRSVEEGDEVEE